MTGFIYKSYSFLDKDPMIDYVRTVIRDSGETLKQIGEDSGVNPQTISKWLYGDTKRPQAASINAVLRALGYRLEIVPKSYVATIKPIGYTTMPRKGKVIQLSRKRGGKQ